MNRLLSDLKASIAPLQKAKQAFQIAQKAFNKTEGAQTLGAVANVVRLASRAGTIRDFEIPAALAIVKKKAQGFKLTPQELELAGRIANGARTEQGAGKGVMIAVPAAAAAVGVATLLL